jgi:hypothetical protein
MTSSEYAAFEERVNQFFRREGVNNLPNFPSFDRLKFPTSLNLFGPSYRLSPATLSATDSAV